jgi:mannan endo-1,4-beta-mannosidase
MADTLTSRRDVLRGAAIAAGTLVVESCATGGAGASRAVVNRPGLPGGLEVKGTRFYRDGKPFFVSGFNYWAPMTLARDGNAAGWDQVRRDLDGLQAAGINMLRIMAATEGPDSEPQRIVPSLQPALGQYDPAGVAGLVKLVGELEQRKLLAILTLNNFWQWSGGMAQYLAWAGKGAIPYPPPAPGGSWDRFQHFSGGFYTNDAAKQGYLAFVSFIVPKLKASPVVIWELCNEARGMRNVGAYRKWIDETAGLIHQLAPGQLVTTGSEGQTASPSYAGLDTVKDHQSANIDFITCHMWAQNWGWVKKENVASGFPKAKALAEKYVATHAEMAVKVGKPILLEEFGFPRDGASFDPGSPVAMRDEYFDMVYAQVHGLMEKTPMAGIMPWAWAGDSKPPRPGQFWKPGDPFVGDPPHEEQGWYSVYTGDSTLQLIKKWSAQIAARSGAVT